MPDVNSKLIKCIGDVTAKFAAMIASEAGVSRADLSVDEIQQIWSLGIQQLPYHKFAEHKVRGIGITQGVQRMYVLQQLGQWGMLPKSALEEKLQEFPGDSTNTLSDMRLAGVISFFTSDDNGKEVEFAFLTGEGQAQYEEIHARRQGLCQELLEPLDDDEREQLLALLTKIVG